MLVRTYSEEEKAALVEEFKQSDLGSSTFAKQYEIPESTFRGWLKADTSSAFGAIELKSNILKSVPKVSSKTKFFSSENIRIELKENFDKDFFRKLVEVMIDD